MPTDDALMAAQCCVERPALPAGPLAGLCCARYRVEAKSPHRMPATSDLMTSMSRLFRIALPGALAAALAGCAVPVQTTQLAGGPEPVTVRKDKAKIDH